MKKTAKIFSVFAPVYLFFVNFASAAFLDIWRRTGKSGGSTCNIDPAGCGLCDGLKVAVNIVNDASTVATILVTGMMVYGAIRLMISGGSEEMVKEAKGIFKSAVIGLIIVLCSWLIIDTVIHLIAGPSNPFPWNNIQC